LILVGTPLPPHHLSRLSEWDLRVNDRTRPSPDELIALLDGCEAVIGATTLPLSARVLDGAPALRAISIVGVGYDHVDLVRARERGVAVSHTPGVLTDAVADLTIALMLTLTRRLPEAIRDRRPVLGHDVRGKTMLIVGFGRIGREVARRALVLGMRVVWCDAREGTSPMRGTRRVRMDRGLREADVLCVHVDLNESTRGLIGRSEIRATKPGAWLVNTSRGGVVDEDALREALESGHLAGAALDVLDHEPIREDEPLLDVPNVVLTPHVGSATVETRDAMFSLAVDNLIAMVRGEPCRCLVPNA
jgi:glyoxylate reductase